MFEEELKWDGKVLGCICSSQRPLRNENQSDILNTDFFLLGCVSHFWFWCRRKSIVLTGAVVVF